MFFSQPMRGALFLPAPPLTLGAAALVNKMRMVRLYREGIFE
jgi:hypothetical protein